MDPRSLLHHPDLSAAAVWTQAEKDPHLEITSRANGGVGVIARASVGETTETEAGKGRNGLRGNPGLMGLTTAMIGGEGVTRMTTGGMKEEVMVMDITIEEKA